MNKLISDTKMSDDIFDINNDNSDKQPYINNFEQLK